MKGGSLSLIRILHEQKHFALTSLQIVTAEAWPLDVVGLADSFADYWPLPTNKLRDSQPSVALAE